MKKILFMFAAVAFLAVGCEKKPLETETPTNPETPADSELTYPFDGKQWTFSWEAMGMPINSVFDFGLFSEDKLTMAVDAAALAPGMTGMIPYLVGNYTITVTSATSAEIKMVDPMDPSGAEVVITLTDITENSFKATNELPFGLNNTVFTLASTPVEIIDQSDIPTEPEDPETPEDPGFEAGDYWITATKSGETVVMQPLDESKTYGYANSEELTEGNYSDNVFTFTEVDGGFTITDASGRYYYQEAGTTYKTFNVGTDGSKAGCVWTVEEQEDGTVIITNAASGKVIRQGEGTHTSFGVYGEGEGEGSVLVELVPADNAEDRPVLDLDKLSASVEADATTYTINVESNLSWTATASEGITLDKTSGTGNAAIVLTFAANTAEEAHTGTVTFTAEGIEKVFTLTHMAVPSDEPATGVKTLTNAEILAAMTGTDTSYSTYEIESASGTWSVNASSNKNNTYLQCRGRKGGYIKTPEFDKDIKSVTIYFSTAKGRYADNVYCVFPSSWTVPTADAAYPDTGNVGKATTDGSDSLTIPVNAGNKQVYISIIGTYAYYLDHIDVAF